MDMFGALVRDPNLLNDPAKSLIPFGHKRGGTALGDGGAALVLMSDAYHKKLQSTM
jgi:3-oxoacyl-(acyl-carrier-protein) synthase